MWAALESQRPILFILIICVGLFHHAFYAVPLVPLRKHIKHVIGAQKHNLTFQNLSFFSKNPDVDHHLSHPNHAFASSPSPSFTSTNDEDFKDKSLIYQFLFISAVIGLIMLGGVVSGLTLGLMALDETNLLVLQKSGSPEQRRYASKILPVRKKSYLLLCTLLVANAIVNESLPILIDRICGEGWLAILISTILLLLFAELLPQAFFTRYGLVAGAHLIWLVKVFMVIFFPIAYPLSCLVRLLLGDHTGMTYKRNELKELVGLLTGNQLTKDEVSVITGALTLIERKPEEIMIPLEDVYMLDSKTIITRALLAQIREKGYSRIPVYEDVPHNVVAVLLTKYLSTDDSCLEKRIYDLQAFEAHKIAKTASLFAVLTDMRQGHHGHMSIIIDKDGKAVGILTLEDIIEELLQQEIIDETDVYIDVKTKTKVPLRLAIDPIFPLSPTKLLPSKVTLSASGLLAPTENSSEDEQVHLLRRSFRIKKERRSYSSLVSPIHEDPSPTQPPKPPGL